MDLTPYVDRLRSDLSDAAAAGGAEAQAAAERLTLALDPATRMVLLEALAQAAAEISGSLDHDAVDVRMAGRDPSSWSRTSRPRSRRRRRPPPAPPAPPEPPEDDSQSRITLRLPESVKARAEEAANQIGQSLNAWLVDAVRDVLDATASGTRLDVHVGRSRISVTGEPGKRKQVRGWVS